MAGCDPLDATSVDRPVEHVDLTESSASRTFAGLRVGVPDEYFRAGGEASGIQPEVEAAVHAAIRLMESHGAQVQPVSLPHTEYALPVYYILAPAEASANLARYDGVRYGPRSPHAESMWDVFYQTRGERFGAEVKRRIMLGTYALSAGYYEAYYGQAQKVRRLIRQDFERAFAQVDVIAAPVAPTTAFKIGAHGDDPLSMYLEDIFTLPANLAGIPAVAFPAGFDAQSLPVGMQLMGPHWQEARLLQAAHAYQQITNWHVQHPKGF
jgi:aspartyl-tRNA(Asn)/glutamyl-tRNA(Gln) amidotransferase subunit A